MKLRYFTVKQIILANYKIIKILSIIKSSYIYIYICNEGQKLYKNLQKKTRIQIFGSDGCNFTRGSLNSHNFLPLAGSFTAFDNPCS